MTRQEIIKAIETCYEVGHGCTECPLFSKDECNNKLIHDVLALLKEQPEVVRCNDCKYCTIAADKKWRQDFGKSIYECDHMHLNSVEPYWFCADGKRKEVVIIEQQ